ncbi:HAD family hydrolase [Candidatus Spongiisocius sp.]|uniref:HAD family hydrolase n=1 Tax=Candidatus Spongiisocius sp. TaxID=3101273 RepID=UPI003B5AC4C9
MKAVLFDLDRTLIDLQTYTDYGAALEDVEFMIGSWDDPPAPATDWDAPTQRCMSILVALSGDPRWDNVSEAIAFHEMAAVTASHAMPRLEEALELAQDIPRAVVTLVAEAPARAVLARHGVDIPVLVPRRPDLRPKPAADQLLEACRLLDVAPSVTVMIGDSTWDAEAAAGAGCGFVGVAATRDGANRFGSGVIAAGDLAVALEVAGRAV